MRNRKDHRIDWDCSCGQEGTVNGEDREDAWRQVRKIEEEHRRMGHREFGVVEHDV
jgi:hypothetical protein